VVVLLPGGDLVALSDIDYGALLTRRGRLWTRFALARANRIIVPSRWMAAQAQALGVETVCIPFGVARDRWPAERPQPRPGATLRLLHVASLNKVKDQATLLRAMALLVAQGVDVRLDIVGQDALGGAIQQLCADLGLAGHVQFHGFHSHAELRHFFADADLLVVSSRHEAGPLVMLEAAIAGLPTVGTAVGHIADWAPDAAIAVPVGDVAALAAAITGLARDDGERLRLAHNAQAIALAEDADATAVRTLRLYRALVSG
jgi:glycosyltransferase involved in cell wall biosynthesis